jgi:hypothetical protein
MLLELPDNKIEKPLGAKMFRLCLCLRAFVTLQGILLVALAHAQIVHFNHHIVSLPQDSEGTHLFSPPQQQQQQQQSNQDAPAPRLCYCDQPSDPDCVECAANHFCMQHPGGPCG